MKLLIAYLIFTFGAIGFISIANAESPFMDVTPECSQYNSTTFTPQGNYTEQNLFCHWEIVDRTVASASQNLTSVEQTALDLMVEKRESGESDIQIDLSYLDETFTVPPIRDPDVIPKSCTRNNPSPSDIEECNLDTKMGFCERGVQSTSPIQQYEHFAVSEYTPRDDLQIDLNSGSKGIVAKLKAYEECRAELVLILKLNQTHYVGISKEVAKGEYNPYHRDFVMTELTYPVGNQIGAANLLSEEWTAYNKICDMPYGDKFLKENGCKFEYEGTYKNNTGITEYEARLLNQGPLADYYKYMETEGIGYYPSWIKKHAVTITSMSPGAEIVIQLPRD